MKSDVFGKNDWLKKFIDKPAEFLRRYLNTLKYFFSGNFRILLKSNKVLSAPIFFLANLAIATALLRLVWPDNPVSNYEIPTTLQAMEPIFELLPIPVVPYAFLFVAIINVPMIIVTLLIGCKLRISSVISASLYSFSISLGVILLAIIVETGCLWMLESRSYETELSVFFIFGISVAIFAIIVVVRSSEFLGIAHGISGYRFFILNALVVGVPLIAITMFTSSDNKLRWVVKALSPGPLQRFHIPSGSMKPTLPIRARVIANKWLSFDQISRGDIVVFQYPAHGKILIKRVIGLPGDTIQMVKGELYLNETLVPRRKLKSFVHGNTGNVSDHYQQTLPNGRKFNIIEIGGDTSPADESKKFLVPDGYFFGLGDNRDNSNDSRFPDVGYIPISNFVGRAYFVTYPRRTGKLLQR